MLLHGCAARLTAPRLYQGSRRFDLSVCTRKSCWPAAHPKQNVVRYPPLRYRAAGGYARLKARPSDLFVFALGSAIASGYGGVWERGIDPQFVISRKESRPSYQRACKPLFELSLQAGQTHKNGRTRPRPRYRSTEATIAAYKRTEFLCFCDFVRNRKFHYIEAIVRLAL